jgi:hypothetical protein
MNFDPQTGQPLKPPNRWRRFRAKAWWVQTLAWLGVGFVAFLALGAIGSATSSKPGAAAASAASAASQPARQTAGVMSKDTLGFGDAEALKQLSIGQVWCSWNGNHVQLHAYFVNQLDAHVTVHVTPGYHLRNAGEHGDGQDLSVGIDAKASRDWTGDLGQPAGVSQSGIRITACTPSVSEVDLG